VQDLPLQVRLVHHVVVDDPDPPTPRRQVERDRRSQPAGSINSTFDLSSFAWPVSPTSGIKSAAVPALRVREAHGHVQRKPRVLPSE